MAAFTDYRALDFSGLDKSINSIAQRQQLSKLGQGLDGTPEGYAKAGQSLLALGDVQGAQNFFALGEKARERSANEAAIKTSPFNSGSLGTPRAPVAPAVSGLGAPRPGESGYRPVPTIANSEAEVQALEGSTGTPGQQVAARLVNNGLTPTAASGLASNLNSESRFRTNAVNPGDGRDGSDSIGMAQWNGPRAEALKQFASSQGKPWTDPNVQADFIAYELRTTEGRAGSAIANAQTPQQAGAAAIGYFRPQGYTAGNPLAALGAGNRVNNANQFVLGGEPAPASGQFVPQPSQIAQAPQGAPAGGDGLYTNTPTPALQAFVNNPRVPDNLRTIMQQELARREGSGAPAAEAPVQLAQAPAQPGQPVADMPAQGAAPVQAQFAIPGPNQLPPNDPRPDISTPQLLEVLANPRLASQHAIAKTILDGRQRYSDENAPEKREQTRLATEKARLDIEKARREASGLLTPEQEAQKIRLAQAGRTQITNTMGATESEYAKANGKAISERFSKIVDEGDAAQQEAGAIARLKELGGSIKNMGAGAALQARLAEYGVKVGENVSEIEAYNALIDKLTPQQRLAGSGATSDFDAKMFKNSLPGLIRTPQGNALIIETMEALNIYKRQRADIVSEAMALNEKPADVVKRLKELPDPFAAFKEARKGATGDAQPPARAAPTPAAAPPPQRPAAGTPRTATNPNTGERIMLTPDGQWVPYS
jgi:hypothetical protein